MKHDAQLPHEARDITNREFCRFGKRDLEKMSWIAPLVNNPLGDALNLEMRHEHLFFIKGDQVLDNVGYSEKGKRFNEADFGKPIENLEEMERNGYWLAGRTYDPAVMREALRRQNDGYYYSVFTNQCQDWVDRLKKRAAEVEKEWGLKPGEFLDGEQPPPRPRPAEEKRVPPTEPASLGMGVVAVLLGVAAILTPILFGSKFALLIGLFFLASGVSHTIYAFKGRDFRLVAPVLFFAGLYYMAGLFLLLNREYAVMTASLLIAILLAVEGVSSVGLALFSRPLRNWLGTLAAGVVMILCAIAVFTRWPLSGARFLGVMVGVSFIVGGLSTIYLSQRTRSEAV